MKISAAYVAVLLTAYSAIASTKVETKILNTPTENDQWRKIGIRISNEGNDSIALKEKIIKYYFADSMPQAGNIWLYQINSNDWIYHIQGIENASIKIDTSNSLKKFVEISFLQTHAIPPNGTLELQFGLHRLNYTKIDASNDYSFLNSLEYVKNDNVFFGNASATQYLSYNDTSLLGRDLDGNKVRDDIDDYIKNLTIDDTSKIILNRMSTTLDSMITTNDTSEAIRLNRKYLALSNCAIGKLSTGGDISQYVTITRSEFAKQINTPIRLKSYFRFKSKLAGMVFKIGSSSFNESCLEEL